MTDAESKLLETAYEVAEEQGAKDAEAVMNYYLTTETRRRYRRIFFRREIRRILPDDTNTRNDFDSSLDDFE